MKKTTEAKIPERIWELRPDLEIFAAESPDGGPAILVHDPLSGNFDRVEWPESDLVRLLAEPRGLDSLRAAFTAENPLKPTARDVLAYVRHLGERGWLRGSDSFPKSHREKKRGGMTAFFSKVLFVQLPLLRPASFLRRTSRPAALLINRFSLALVLLCGIFGLCLTLPRWEDYWRDSLGGITMAALPGLFIALIAVKTLHEAAHAYAATLTGARVAAMGVALFFLLPLPYTDVTDAWRLSWRRRLVVATAGMAAEFGVACVALSLWALSPPGAAATVLARLSSAALLSTLLTNINPGPRFDGYYALVCLFRTENLRARAAAMLRGILDRRLFGLPAAGEEHPVAGRSRVPLLLYAAYALFYRTALGAGLAAMAYSLLPKALGLPAAVAVAWLFLGLPATRWVRGLWIRRKSMRPTPAMIVLLLLAAGLAAWAVGAWPRRVHFPAVVRAEAEEAVRPLRSGVVKDVLAARGETVGKGDLLAVLESPWDEALEKEAFWALRESELAEDQSWRGARREAPWREAETNRRRAEAEAVRRRRTDLEVRSPASGVLAVWNEAVRPGLTLPRGSALGIVAGGGAKRLDAYPEIGDARKLKVGDRISFFPDAGGAPLAGVVTRIEPTPPERLNDAELAGALGAVPGPDGELSLPVPRARIIIELDGEAARIGQTGRVWAWSEPESLLASAWRWLKSLAVRESAF